MQNNTGFSNFSSSLSYELAVHAFVSMTPCFFFLYVNLVMLFTLRSKEVFCETPRYILFGNLLSSDSLQLALTIVFYILYRSEIDEAALYILGYFCFLIYLVCRVTNNYLSPLYLALMSLERYVAICFPLRHAQIANRKRTTVLAIGVWILGLIFWIADLTMTMTFEARSSTRQLTCTDFIILQGLISYIINSTITGIIFASVCLVIIYTYIAILMTAKSASSEKTSASKAHKTVLLHMVQLGLYLLSLLFGMIRRALALTNLPPMVVEQVNYVLFLGLNIIPRCLSPLIYGLRDKMFSGYFKYCFFFCIKSKSTAVNMGCLV